VTLLIAIPVALLIGLSLGALGGGGSILTVPALVYLLGQSAHAATTGSLIIVGVTALASMLAHARARHVRMTQGSLFAVLGIAGTYAGSHLSARVDPDVLLAAFSVVIVAAATAMLLRRRRGAPSRSPADARLPVSISAGPFSGSEIPETFSVPGRDWKPSPPAAAVTSPSGRRRPIGARRVALVVATATGVGLVTGFFGVGGGFVVVPALVLALGYDMPVAVGTSLLVIALNSATALAARAGQHVTLDWPLLGVFTAVAVLGSLVGGRVSSRANPDRLTIGFVVLLYAVAAYTGVRSGAHLF
jgi:uncharacterized membrane protein YfcA